MADRLPPACSCLFVLNRAAARRSPVGSVHPVVARVRPLPVGWSLDHVQAQNGRSVISLDNDRAATGSLQLTLTARCDIGRAGPALSPCTSVRRYRAPAMISRPPGSTSAGLCLYRDGRDSVAWHGDTIGRGRTEDTMVAILSLGTPRPLLLRPRRGGASLRFEVGHGDLLVMGGSCQRAWEHAVPKTSQPVGPRISVQFRPRGVR